MNHTETILTLISSDAFKARMETINTNYFNLMQEGVIRNAILELFNSDAAYHHNQTRAIAEHPRIKNMRYDLSLIDKQDVENKFKIELKFRFNKLRSKDFAPYLPIDTDFIVRDADLFILIIAGGSLGEKKSMFDAWGIDNGLLKYTSVHDFWKDKYNEGIQMYINELCKEKYRGAVSHTWTIQTSNPPYTEYVFFILSKEQHG